MNAKSRSAFLQQRIAPLPNGKEHLSSLRKGRRAVVKRGGDYADDGEVSAVKSNVLAENVAGRTEFAPPKPGADKGDGCRPDFIFAWREGAPHQWLHA